MSSPAEVAVSWCSQAAMVAASRAPHIQAMFTRGYPEVPESGAELAVAEDVLHGGVVPAPVLGRYRLVRGSHVQAGQDKRVGIDRPGADHGLEEQQSEKYRHALIAVVSTGAGQVNRAGLMPGSRPTWYLPREYVGRDQTCDLQKLQVAPLTVPLFIEGLVFPEFR
jgi:hypothetical protein